MRGYNAQQDNNAQKCIMRGYNAHIHPKDIKKLHNYKEVKKSDCYFFLNITAMNALHVVLHLPTSQSVLVGVSEMAAVLNLR